MAADFQHALAAAVPGDSHNFATSIAISGATAAVGVPGETTNGTDAGSVWIWELAAGTWTRTIQIFASNASADSRFGTSVALDGDLLVVGAPLDDADGADSGSVYVHRRDEGGADTWGEVKKLALTGITAGDNFGDDVTVSDTDVVAGAPGRSSSQGIVGVFEQDQGGGDNFGEVTTLTGSGAAGSLFGGAVALDGATLVVGLPGHGSGQGLADIFEASSFVKSLTSDDADSDQAFGYSAAVEGDTIAVGMFYGSDEGFASLYDRDGGAWTLAATPGSPSGFEGDRFGASLDLSGDFLVVGWPATGAPEDEPGGADVFGRDIGGAGQWGHKDAITAPAGLDEDLVGHAVAIDAADVLVGAPVHDPGSSPGAGEAYYYTLTGHAEVTPEAGAFGDVAAGKFKTISFTIGNLGPVILNLGASSITGPGAARYGIDSDTGESTIAVGGPERTVVVRFTPGTLGAFAADLEIPES